MAQTKFKIGSRTVELGKTYYSAYYEEGYEGCEDYPREPETVKISEHVLRTVRRPARGYLDREALAKRAHFVKKIPGVTWVKKSKKHYDYGWVKSISQWHKTWFMVGKESDGYFHNFTFSNTIAGAIRQQMAVIRKSSHRSADYKKKAIKKLTQRLNKELKKCANQK